MWARDVIAKGGAISLGAIERENENSSLGKEDGPDVEGQVRKFPPIFGAKKL